MATGIPTTVRTRRTTIIVNICVETVGNKNLSRITLSVKKLGVTFYSHL